MLIRRFIGIQCVMNMHLTAAVTVTPLCMNSSTMRSNYPVELHYIYTVVVL